MLNTAVRNTNKLVRETSQKYGIRIGNRFTKKPMARRIGSMIASDVAGKESFSICDAGAGTGILTAAAVEELCRRGVKEITADLYETDESRLAVLDVNMRRVRRICHHDYGVKFRFTLHDSDFCVAYAPAETLFSVGEADNRFDLVLCSPDTGLADKNAPFFSLYQTEFGNQKESGDGDVKPYGLPVDISYYFLSAGLRALSESGQMLIVLPTVFAVQDAAARLRRNLFAEYAVPELCLFSEKNKIRDTTGALRGELKKEMVLSVLKKEPQEAVTLSVSEDGGETAKSFSLSLDFFLRDGEKRMLLLQSEKELSVVKTLEALPETLSTLGLRMKTGLTIPSKYQELLSETAKDGYIPLLSPSHMQNGHTVFPLHSDAARQYILPRIPSLKQRNRNMLLLRRVPAKSDKRHLFAAVYLSSILPYYDFISTDNKLITLDKIGEDGDELSSAFLHGLYALFNSSTYEFYLSILSKAAEVSAVEYKNLPLPDENTVTDIGRIITTSRQYTKEAADVIVRNKLHIAF